MYRKSLHIYSILVACSTVILLAAGGMVTSTGSGLAVPDWPLSYGKLMPPMVGGILYEHGHRMIASGVGFLTVILTFWIFRTEERLWVRVLGATALGAVIIQGLLGGLTVLLLLPTWVSASHASLAQSFFCLVAAIALATSRWWVEGSLRSEMTIPYSTLSISLALASAIFVQLILGAVMRHSNAGLIVPDFPFADGAIFPSLSTESLHSYELNLIQKDLYLAADGRVSAFQIVIHLLHRYWGFAVVIGSLVAALQFYRNRKASPIVKFAAFYVPALLLVQATLGYETIVSRKDPVVATIHQTTGAIVLMSLVLLSFILARLRFVARGARSLQLANG
jgi:cytochrome c oxidase assembly protein subunit 15